MAGALARFAAVIDEEVAENYLANDTSAFGGRFDPRSYGGLAVLDEHLGDYVKTMGRRAGECFLLRWISDRPADFPPSFGSQEGYEDAARAAASAGGRIDPVYGDPPFLGTGYTPGGVPEWKPYRPAPFGASAMIWRMDADGRTAPWGTYSDGVWLRAGASNPESPAAGPRAEIPANGRFAGYEGTEYRAYLDVETELMAWLVPTDGGPAQRVSPQKLDHWYDVWTRFVWRERVFLALRIGADQVEGQLCNGSLSWARSNGLEICSPDHVYGRFPLAEISGLREVRTDLLAEWGARNLSPTPGPGSGTDFGRRLRDALAPESGEPDVDALVATWPGGSGPWIVLDYVLEALAVNAFSGPNDRGVLAFSRELGTALSANHPIEPIHVATTVSRALGNRNTETMPPPELPPVERLRTTLAICAKIGGFRGREHIDWLIWQGEAAAARAGHVVS